MGRVDRRGYRRLRSLVDTLRRLVPDSVRGCIHSGARQRRGQALAPDVLFFASLPPSGPALWLAHNRYYFGDALYFYRGPWSAAAIQGNADYPGRGDWRTAIQYFLEAGKLVTAAYRHAPRRGRNHRRHLRAGRSGLCFCWLCCRHSTSGACIPLRRRRFSFPRSGRSLFTTHATRWHFCRLLALGIGALARLGKGRFGPIPAARGAYSRLFNSAASPLQPFHYLAGIRGEFPRPPRMGRARRRPG